MSSRNKKKKKYADYVLYQALGIPVAVVEAKNNNYTVSQGIQQALGHAGILDTQDNDGAFCKRYLVADLSQLIPTSNFNIGCDELIANVYFTEFFFIKFFQNELTLYSKTVP